jgi:Bacterial archaeo-eukaryotic release factor family 3
MISQETVPSKVVSWADLRSLSVAQGQCITIALEIANPAQIRPQITNALHEVERRLRATEIDADTARMLAEPIHELAATIETEGDWGFGIILFRSPEVFRYFRLPELPKEFVTIGNRFQIRPLLGLFAHEQRFYLLALSQKHVRLFDCTQQSMEELQLPAKMPRNLEAWLNNRIPDHVLDNRSSAGPGEGSMKGVMFGTNTDREKHDEYLAHFFKEVDKGLRTVLLDKTIPLVVAAVEPEIAIYRRVNTYPRLTQQAVHGSPDGLTIPELHQRAVALLRQTFSAPLMKARTELENYRGTHLVSLNLHHTLRRAHEGRVSYLLLRQDAEQRGTWDEETQQVQTGDQLGRDEDLLNLAAIATLAHHGRAFGLEASEMPNGVDAAAVLRF